jgi:hypothetical protein
MTFYKTYTCICRENNSGYPYSLIYTVQSPSMDREIITLLCHIERQLELECDFDLEVLFVFEGDLTPIADWRE